jgi:hypothetical protein
MVVDFYGGKCFALEAAMIEMLSLEVPMERLPI